MRPLEHRPPFWIWVALDSRIIIEQANTKLTALATNIANGQVDIETLVKDGIASRSARTHDCDAA